MGLIGDTINGLIAVLAAVAGQLIAAEIVLAIRLPLFSIVLAIVGLFITGFGLKRRGIISAIIVGIGLGFAAVLVSLIYSLF